MQRKHVIEKNTNRAQVYPHDFHIYDEINCDTYRMMKKVKQIRRGWRLLIREEMTTEKKTNRTEVYPYDVHMYDADHYATYRVME